MKHLVPVWRREDVPAPFRNTPIEDFLAYHNGSERHPPFSYARILLAMCIDYRERARIPERFAYVMRTAGANLRPVEFQVSYAIAVAGISAIAVVGHTNCAMVNLMSKRDEFVSGLVRAGWNSDWADSHFLNHAPFFEIGNEKDFVLSETKRLRQRYPHVVVAPLMYRVEDNFIYLVREELPVQEPSELLAHP